MSSSTEHLLEGHSGHSEVFLNSENSENSSEKQKKIFEEALKDCNPM